MYICVCTYVCMYACCDGMYVCMYVVMVCCDGMYVRTYVCCDGVCVHVCMYVRMYVCLYVCTLGGYAWMDGCCDGRNSPMEKTEGWTGDAAFTKSSSVMRSSLAAMLEVCQSDFIRASEKRSSEDTRATIQDEQQRHTSR